MNSKFVFNLKFDNLGTEDFVNVADSEVSKVLDMIVSRNGSAENDCDILLHIMATRFYVGDGCSNNVIKTMLNFLVASDSTSVAYCFDCNKYVVSHTAADVCAYDTIGHTDSHRTFHVNIVEIALPAIGTICRDAIHSLDKEVRALSDGLICSREFLNKIVDIVCTAQAEAQESECSAHHACGTEPGDHGCSCIRK